jgi:transcriptional regulator with XRE-family HTH domain
MKYLLDYRLIGLRVRERRLALKLTQETLAESAGIGIQHMSKIENGKTKLSLPCLVSLANALETTVDKFLIDNITVTTQIATAEADAVFADCTPAEIYIITQTINTLKKSMRSK